MTLRFGLIGVGNIAPVHAAAIRGTPDAELVAKGGQLFMKAGTALATVTKIGANRFAATRPGAAAPQEFTLTRGKDGKTLYLLQGTRALRKIGGGATS